MSNSSQAKNFRQHIRQYNSAFAFASLRANIDKITTRGPYCKAETITIKQTVLIPRIKLAPSDINLPFVLERHQFPVRLAYSMTINKAQGQTFDKVGIYLLAPVFSHGQLYVALSRAKSFKDIYMQICEATTQGR